MQRLIAVSIVALALIGCSRKVYVPIETQNQTTRYVETTIEKVVTDTVTVYLDIPEQSASVTTPDTISHLETDYAESWARWSGGLLTHTLRNKAASKPFDVAVQHTETEHTSARTDTVTIYKPYTVTVEKPLTTSQRIKIASFWWLLLAVVISIGYIFRHPIANMVNRFL